jgi:Fic family protein
VGTLQDSVGILNVVPSVASGSLLYWNIPKDLFVVHFLAIHPFQDGNGRLSRALTTLLLLQSGYSHVVYSSMESIIEASKEGYYRALRRTQQHIWSAHVDYEPWLSFFLTALQKQKLHLQEKLSSLPLVDQRLSHRARTILELSDREDRWTIAAMANILDVNSNTVSKSVKSLVDGGYLVKQGTTRGAWYERPAT